MTYEIGTYYSEQALRIRATRTARGDFFVSHDSIKRALARSTAPVGDAARIPSAWIEVAGGFVTLSLQTVVFFVRDGYGTQGKITKWLPRCRAEVSVIGENSGDAPTVCKVHVSELETV